MANAYAAPNFSIDTDIDEAGLVTLKGSAIAATDNIYAHSGATVTLAAAANLSLNILYINDNPAGSAVTKTGYIIINKPGYTVTLNDSTANGGLNGKTGAGVGHYTIMAGTTIKDASGNKVSDYNVRACPNVYTGAIFDGIAQISVNTNYQVTNCDIKNAPGTYAWVFYGMPAAWSGNSITDAAAATRRMHINFSPTDAQLNTIGANFKVVRAAASTNSIPWYLDEATGTHYLKMKRSTGAWDTAPTWNSSVGIVSLTANADGSLTAAWNGATSGTGQAVTYRIYLRAGSAPNSFGVAGTHFLCEVAGTSKKFAYGVDNNVLDIAQTYYAIVRCVDSDGNEDSNTTAAAVAPVATVPTMLTTIKRLIQALPATISQ